MPHKNATFYKRFNVGQYIQQKRLRLLAVEEKSKKARNTAQKLKRLDVKVRDISYIFVFFLLIEFLIYRDGVWTDPIYVIIF
jgi:hypothetical protein